MLPTAPCKSPNPSGIRTFPPSRRRLLIEIQNQRKELGRYAASSFPYRFDSGRSEPISCSSFNWKMLAPRIWEATAV